VAEHLGLRFFALAVLIVCSAILTGAEAAYFSLGRARLRHVTASTDDTDDTTGAPKPLIERPHELLVTLLVGITVINIGAAAIAATIADSLFGPSWGVFVEMIVLIFVLTTFGEVLPMTLAVKYPDRFLAFAGRPVAWLGVVLAPVRAALAGLTALTVGLLGRGRAEQATLSEEELRTLVDVGASEGVVEGAEREMIHKVFELEDTFVRSVMVPRPDMICLDVGTPAGQILPALREHLHSRVPVYEGSIDVIVGILYTKDLLPYMDGLPAGFDLRAHLHPPYFVPESKRADTLLQEFQAKRLHMAIVVDEYGGTAGLVTLEDLLEELVGEISDEYEKPERLIQRVDGKTFRVSGKLSIEDLNAVTGLKVTNEGYDTVGGWVLDLFGRVPRRSERTETPEAWLTVEKVERTRILEVLVSLKRPAPKEAAA
jgi:magnesium and cobalt exporter, CNNM family